MFRTKFLMAILAILFSIPTKAQAFGELLKSRSKISEEQLSMFKETKTVFFYKKDTDSALTRLKAAVLSGWTITPVIFDDFKNFNKYSDSAKYSHFTIDGDYTHLAMDSRGNVINNRMFGLVLRMVQGTTKKGKPKIIGLGMFLLHANAETGGLAQKKNNEVLPAIYDRGWFYNWDPILIKSHLQIIQNDIMNGMRPNISVNIKTPNIISLLASDTLYVPQVFLMPNFNVIRDGKYKHQFENYPYPYRICTAEELYQIFEVEKRGRFLFEFSEIYGAKTLTVLDTKDKVFLYKKQSTGWFLGPADIKQMIN